MGDFASAPADEICNPLAQGDAWCDPRRELPLGDSVVARAEAAVDARGTAAVNAADAKNAADTRLEKFRKKKVSIGLTYPTTAARTAEENAARTAQELSSAQAELNALHANRRAVGLEVDPADDPVAAQAPLPTFPTNGPALELRPSFRATLPPKSASEAANEQLFGRFAAYDHQERPEKPSFLARVIGAHVTIGAPSEPLATEVPIPRPILGGGPRDPRTMPAADAQNSSAPGVEETITVRQDQNRKEHSRP